MRARGKPEFEVADIFMDFNAIQMTLPVMAQALIDGRIDCKTAGRLAVGLQTAAKLLRLCQRQTLNTKDTRSTPLSQAQGRSGQATEHKREPSRCDREIVKVWPDCNGVESGRAQQSCGTQNSSELKHDDKRTL
jgi:hypothetical protein